MRRSGAASLAGSPVLVGAVTVLVTMVAVFLSYNANQGLPFVPTYDLRANMPSAAELVRGNDVRIGGTRVGAVSAINARRRPGGSPYAELELKLDKSVQPLPEDSTLLVRPRSSLGLKYLEIMPGKSRHSFTPGPRSRSSRRGRSSSSWTRSSTCSTTAPARAAATRCRASATASPAAARR